MLILKILCVILTITIIILLIAVHGLFLESKEEFNKGFDLAFELYAKNGETPIKCCNCKKKFYSDEYKIKIVTKSTSLYNNIKYDVFDCPNCGRQNILGERL